MHHQLGSYILSKAWVFRKKERKIKLQNRLEGTGGHIYPTAELHLAVDVMLHCISLRFCYSFNNSLTTDKIWPIIYCLINYAKNYAIIKLNVHTYFPYYVWTSLSSYCEHYTVTFSLYFLVSVSLPSLILCLIFVCLIY